MNAYIFGTFNPVTNAHIQMGIVTRNVLGPKCKVIYVPDSDEYIKSWKGYTEGSRLPGKERVGLLRDAVKDYGFGISTVEVEGITDGKTYNTLKYLGFEDTFLCLGIDNIVQIKKWYRWHDLLKKVRLMVFEREGYNSVHSDDVTKVLEAALEYNMVTLPAKTFGISSTEVRRCYINGELSQLKAYVPANVYDYLKENKNVYY